MLVCLQTQRIWHVAGGICLPRSLPPWVAVPVCYLKAVSWDMPGACLWADFLFSAKTRAWGLGLPLPSSADVPGGGETGLGGRDGGQRGWGKEALK